MFDVSELDLTVAKRNLSEAAEAVRKLTTELMAATKIQDAAQRRVAKAATFDRILQQIRSKIDSLQATHREVMSTAPSGAGSLLF